MKKYLFVDRDGTLIEEPSDFQIDSVAKFRLKPRVLASLRRFVSAGYRLVMVSNQDRLGSDQYPQAAFDEIQNLLLGILGSEGILFEKIFICPHGPEEKCPCRKPSTSMLSSFLASSDWDRSLSAMVGDRDVDVELGNRLGVRPFLLTADLGWEEIAHQVLDQPRQFSISRETTETQIRVKVDLDGTGLAKVVTGIGFLDHMLALFAFHGKMNLEVLAKGDLHIDDHHLVEDVALCLGSAISKALGDRRGIGRYAFWLPMDESSAALTMDICGRSNLVYEVQIHTDRVGGMSREMIKHFFKSFSDSLGLSLHVRASGENSHHIVEGIFKAFGRCLGEAVRRSEVTRNSSELTAVPSSKGLL
jgi:imidazoleglycerol-phosphate dehydratase/histidinol-phosphatase